MDENPRIWGFQGFLGGLGKAFSFRENEVLHTKQTQYFTSQNELLSALSGTPVNKKNVRGFH